MRHWLAGVNDIGELKRVLNKEDGNVVTNEIKVAFRSVELGGESTNISNGISRSYAISLAFIQ